MKDSKDFERIYTIVEKLITVIENEYPGIISSYYDETNINFASRFSIFLFMELAKSGLLEYQNED